MAADRPHESIRDLSTPIQFAKGVGSQRAELLDKLGIHTVKDLLFCFPRDYQEAARLCSVSELQDGQIASLLGTVEEIELRNTGAGRCMLGVLVRQDREYVRAIWFNQPFMRNRFRRGNRVLLSGEPRFHGGRWEFVHPRVEELDSGVEPEIGGIQAVYSLTEGLRQWQMRKMAQAVVERYAGSVAEVFPEDFRSQRNLLPIAEAIAEIHGPEDADRLQQAQRRFVYQELLTLQLALALRKRQLAERSKSPKLCVIAKIDARIRRLFPFELTSGQNQAIREICDDMARPVPMNRLLQGDVGSGKTVVAEYAMLVGVALGYQVALMVPTEILAQQHYRTVLRDLHASRVRVALLTGSLPAAERRQTLSQIAGGEVDLIVGTHALLQEQVRFSKLGLVVIDEQHKFGVAQRAALRRSGADPHYLVMTATPIPRTISMTLFGDLDVSILREPPPNRAPVHTYPGDQTRRAAWWKFYRRKLQEGRQGYVISPLIDGDEGSSVQGVEDLRQELAGGELAGERLGLLHGRMSAREKEQAMLDFERGKTRVLVATSVIEVGVDVPNATLMTITGGERFGLAQLHQLRGRVSRGRHPGFVCVFSNSPSETSQQRLDAFCNTNDGFELAELDFRQRGPGTLFSQHQHGLPPFRIADLVRDAECVAEARSDAQNLVESGEFLSRDDFAGLRKMVDRRYGRVMELVDVG